MIYKARFKSRYQNQALIKLFKLSLLITFSTVNVECGFSVLTLLSPKLQNSMAPKTLDKLMGLILIEPNVEESYWNKVIDLHKSRKNRHMVYLNFIQVMPSIIWVYMYIYTYHIKRRQKTAPTVRRSSKNLKSPDWSQ